MFSRWNGRLPEDRSNPGLRQRTDHCDHHGTGCGERPVDSFGCRGKEYVIHGISEKLRTRDEEQVDVKALSAGDTLTVLSDGAALLSAPSQFAHIYKIYWEE